MKFLRGGPPVLLVLLLACQSQTQAAFAIVDGDAVRSLQSRERAPAGLLARASLSLGPQDRLLVDGRPVAMDQPLDLAGPRTTLQIRRALPLSLVTPDGTRTIQSSAGTVGEALREAGLELHSADLIAPPVETPISAPMTIVYTPARLFEVAVDGRIVPIRSAAGTVGQVLAAAGIPLLGLDISRPPAEEAPPPDGQIRVIRVAESLVLAQKSLPFGSEFIASADVELDHQEVLEPGQPGLAVSRVRILYQDGQEISRETESESVVRPPQNRVVGYGTKIVVHTTVVDGVKIEYWRSVQVFATSYSPCRSAADRCYPGTSSGKPVQKGVVAVVKNWYYAMQGQPIYVPGYGHATIEDIGGGIPGKPWIDLGYSDSDWQEWGQWVTVYFLTPAPANILNPLD
jgi:uncharacterized protein YabE (DUF348 family)